MAFFSVKHKRRFFEEWCFGYNNIVLVTIDFHSVVKKQTNKKTKDISKNIYFFIFHRKRRSQEGV